MNTIFRIVFTACFLISGPVFSQSKLTVEFDLYEMVLEVNGKVVDNSIVGRDCTLIYSYREKKYEFACTPKFNKNKLFLYFYFIETKNNETYVGFSKNADVNSRFIVKDSIYNKNKIEFKNSKVEENGDLVSLIYKYYNKY
jgi:hypothetical protein